jgi:uncharacterized protein
MTNHQPFLETSNSETPVRGFLHRPAAPNEDCLVLTHGAGANCDAPLLVSLAEAFSATGLTVLRCDLPFRQTRPQGPPPRGSAERDPQGLRAAVESMRREVSGRIFLGGHSYGGRQASILAATEPGLVSGLLLLSYPLHPPQRPSELRTAHFPLLRTPALFVSGARDGFGSITEVSEALKLVPAPTRLLPIEKAGHELATTRNRDKICQSIVEAFHSFTRELD